MPMTTAEKISIALPPEMVHIVRGAVATGEYASR
jgi:antitoxin ParD1/3/4